MGIRKIKIYDVFKSLRLGLIGFKKTLSILNLGKMVSANVLIESTFVLLE